MIFRLCTSRPYSCPSQAAEIARRALLSCHIHVTQYSSEHRPRNMSASATSHRPIRLILDFDGTLTTTDTLAPLSQIGYDHAARHHKSSTLPPWSDIVSAYLSDYQAHSSSYVPTPEARSTAAQEAAWLNSLQPIEKASMARAIKAGIWDGVTESEIQDAADRAVESGNVNLRRGWAGLIRRMRSSEGATVEIVSVNWSRCWIRGILQAASRSVGGEERLQLDEVPIYANELPSVVENLGDANDRRSPGADIVLRTSGGKLRQLHERQPDNIASIQDKPFVVYIGDSTTDLECLIEAELGICIRDESMGGSQKELAQTLARLKMDVEWIGGLHSSESQKKPHIVWARDFVEIETHLLSLVSVNT